MSRAEKTSLLAVAVLICLATREGRSEAGRMVLTEANCAQLVAHQPEEDVAYRSGVDARGRRVAPADLEGRPPLALPERTRIGIEVDSGARFGLPSDQASFNADIEVGSVEVLSDGRMTFNGQPLQSETAYRLSQLCQERFGQSE